MRVGILGTGAMTAALGARLVRVGHEVVIGSRDPDRARRLSESIGAAAGSGYREAARAEVVVVAVRDTEVLRIVESLADVLDGVVVIDLNNPIDPPSFQSRYAGAASLAERLAESAPGAKVVKAFNTVYAERLAEGAQDPSDPVQVFLASDDDPAKTVVAALVREIGAEPIDVGPLRAARHLEALAGFEVDLVERGYAPYVGLRLTAGHHVPMTEDVRPRISVVGPNPAMDRTEELEEFLPHRVNRAALSSPRAGGKSFIVARALRRLEQPVALYGFLGGTTGEFLRSECTKLGITDRHTPIADETRINSILVDAATGGVTVINEPGPTVTDPEARALHDALRDDLAKDDLLLLSGSLPRGIPTGFYAELVELARSRGSLAIVDADGEVLVRAVAARPWAVKCNLEEFRAIAPEAPERLDADADADRDRLLGLMKGVVSTGVHLVIVTLGADGLLAVSESDAFQVAAPHVHVKNPTGSGDTFLAAFAAAVVERLPLAEALRSGVAAASANAAVLVPDIGASPDLAALAERTTVQRLGNRSASEGIRGGR